MSAVEVHTQRKQLGVFAIHMSFLYVQYCIMWYQVAAQNPILKNITDYLIEEVSAEEEELLGSVGGADAEEGSKEGNPAEITVERDDTLVKVHPSALAHTDTQQLYIIFMQ